MVYLYRLLPEPGFEYINPACFRLTGYTQEEFYADPFLGMKIIHPDDRASLEAAAKDPSQIQQKVVMRWIRKDGAKIWVERYNTPIHNETGTIEAFEGMVHDITELVTLQEQLNVAVVQKQTFFNELQHRIKNSFTMINGLFTLEMDNELTPEAVDALKKMQLRISSIASVYSMLRVDQSTTKIPINHYAESLIDSLVMDGIERELHVEPIDIPARIVTPLGLIINEMVTNSIKYAFGQGRKGKISMTITRAEVDSILVRIGDNGSGFPEGFTPETSRGLGTQLIEMLSEQIGAERKWVSNHGVTLELKIPIQ